jgi:hypothetical protein
MPAHRETFSKLQLAAECPGSHALPWTQSGSRAARSGTVLHKYTRDYRELGEERAVELVPADMRDAAAGWHLDGIPLDPQSTASEVAFALDLEMGTARELGRDLDRQYEEAGARPDEIVGAADLVSLVVGAGGRVERVIVGDLKTGWRWVPGPRDNWQIRGLVLAAALAYGAEDAEGRIYHRREDGSGGTEIAPFDAFDLAETLDGLRGIRRRILHAAAEVDAGRRPQLREGPWCTFCPSLPDCPVKRDMLVTLATGRAEELVDNVKRALTPETVRAAYQAWKAGLELFDKRLRSIIDDYVRDHGEIDLGGGLVYGPTTSSRETIDGTTAFHLLREIYGEDVAWKAVDLKASKTSKAGPSIDAAVREAIRLAQEAGAPIERGGKKVSATRLGRELLDEIRARGGARTSSYSTIKEHPRKDGE